MGLHALPKLLSPSTIDFEICVEGFDDDKGGMPETSRDLLYLMLFCLIASLVSDYVWYVMFIVPAVGVYKLFTYIGPMIFGGGNQEDNEVQMSKTQQKKA
eukprot:CAMPEP_0184312750 /NCGR_PEP_ID=MMETSP1049-20130417/53245_1 /TAXON_ID=77928 /ORGANISM="Proteomonas sulcata, Strain CCMP704" /LENGTH=99 /DNA_ID=CAMNT_0026629201 /DNA_START=138 /DNA_END=435 /DNA_ORIENTATION=-